MAYCEVEYTFYSIWATYT